jgi:ABC-type glycerol-3-phosphate transport system substrate-binding protein
MKILKRIAAAALSAAMCLGVLGGCREETDAPAAPKDCIYDFAEFIPTNESFDSFSGVDFDGSTIYILTNESEAGGAAPAGDSAGDSAGNSEGGESVLYNTYLLKTDLSGSVIKKQLLFSKSDGQPLAIGDKYYVGVAVGADGSLYLVRQTGASLDTDGGFSDIKTEIVLQNGNTETVLADISGTLAPLGIDTSSLYITDFDVDENDVAYFTVNLESAWAINLKSGELVVDNEPIDNSNSNTAEGGDKYDYYTYNATSIYGYKDGAERLVADLTASGVNLSAITKLIPVSDTQFLLTGYTADALGIEKLYILTKIDPKDVPDKTIIKVAAIEDPPFLAGYLTEFAAAHPEYQVDIKLYKKDESTSFEDALDAFNNDIMAGNVPDVLVIAPEMPYASYVKKGIFADLYSYIESDKEISRDDFYQPFLSALETDGELYSIAPAFQIYTLVGKTSVFGEKQGQSFTELEAAAASIDGASLFGNVNRDYFTDGVFKRAARRFIDDEKGVCSFDSPEFISMLEYAKSLPEPAPDDAPFMGTAWFPDETGDYNENRTLIQFKGIIDFRDIVSIEKIDYGEPITFLGFPNGSGKSGITAKTVLETAITAKAKNRGGAWEFVKGLQSYGDTFIKSIGYPPLVNFPILRSELDIAAKNATIPPFQYNGSTGERVPRQTWLGSDLTNQPNNTEADNAKMYALFESIDSIDRTVPAIENIIAEEIAVYFSGQRSAIETAEIIQNRATTYLEEMK